ncbi:MAG: thioredoxin [Gammaproteobacteria bacterium]
MAHASEVTSETFHGTVVKRSHAVPVLVDYWAQWCGPCQMQLPVLGKLLEEYAGKFELAKVNTDEQQVLAREHGIRSLPTMRLYKDGEIVEEILGAQPESTLRTLLDRHIERESDRLRLQAIELYDGGDREAAFRLLDEAHKSDPENHRLVLEYAGMCLKDGRLDTAADLLAGLPVEFREAAEAARLRALLEFASVARDAPPAAELEAATSRNPEDLEARYQLAAQHILAGRMEEAMEILLYILQHDRAFRDDAGRTGLLAVFNLLGNEGELVSTYRRKLFNAIT